MTFPDQ